MTFPRISLVLCWYPPPGCKQRNQ